MARRVTRYGRYSRPTGHSGLSRREEQIARLAALLERDATARNALMIALEARRRAVARHADVSIAVRKAMIEAVAAPGMLIAHAIDPPAMPSELYGIGDAWRTIGGYLSESMARLKVERHE